MSFETISLLLNWVQLGVLLEILVRPWAHFSTDRQYTAPASTCYLSSGQAPCS
jgi:hypothetical protein